MITIDAPGILKDWHSSGSATVPGTSTTLVLPEPGGINKAGVDFESPSHVSTITMWGSGMIEFIVLDLATKETVITEDYECNSEAEVSLTLNRCRDTLVSLHRA